MNAGCYNLQYVFDIVTYVVMYTYVCVSVSNFLLFCFNAVYRIPETRISLSDDYQSIFCHTVLVIIEDTSLACKHTTLITAARPPPHIATPTLTTF